MLRIFLIKDMLVMEGRTYASHYMIKNIQLGAEGDSMDICVCGMVPKFGGNLTAKNRKCGT
jgi:hypothetical protein